MARWHPKNVRLFHCNLQFHSFCIFLIKFDTVVKLAMHSMSTSLMTSKQAKEMLAKIDDDSTKAEFIANMIVRISVVNDFCAFFVTLWPGKNCGQR
jgi:hypothetical protein